MVTFADAMRGGSNINELKNNKRLRLKQFCLKVVKTITVPSGLSSGAGREANPFPGPVHSPERLQEVSSCGTLGNISDKRHFSWLRKIGSPSGSCDRPSSHSRPT